MKTLKCDWCDATMSGANFEAWVEEAHKHYTSTHSDKLEKLTKEDKAKWMKETKIKFENT